MRILERDRYFDELTGALGAARTKKGNIALVSGEAGIGKTTLVEHFTRRQNNGVRVLWGMCDPLFTPRPLGPLCEMAGQMPARISSLLAPEASRNELFSAFLETLKANPTIVVLEDIHWADAATFDLLRYIGRRISRTSTLLILTYRDNELDRDHPLRIVLGDLATTTALRRVSLPPLSQSAVRTMVGDQPLNPEALHRRSGGNPFFVSAVLANGEIGIPATIRDVILARAARLSHQGRSALEAAAVIGQRVEPQLLAAVTGLGTDAVEECLTVGLLLEKGDALVFRHELARETILETISTNRKTSLHSRILDAFKTPTSTPVNLARLAHHAEASGNRDAVLEYGPAAAQQASASGAHREAAALYAMVLRYAGDLDLSDRALLLEAYSRECNLIERPVAAIETMEKALATWQQLKKIRQQGQALARLTIMLRNHGKNARAEQVSREAIELLTPLPPSQELAMAYRAQATLRLANRDIDDAIQWGNKAIALAETFNDLYVQGMAHVAVGSAQMFQDYERGRTYLEERLKLELEIGQGTHIANLYLYLGACSSELRHFFQAERYLLAGLEYVADQTLDIFSRTMSAWLALTYIHLGKWRDAERVIRKLHENPTDSALCKIPLMVAQGRLRALQGEFGAFKVLTDALQLATQTSNLPYLGLVQSARAEAALLAGERAGARDAVNSVYDLAISKRHPWFVGELSLLRSWAGEKVDVPEWTARPYALQIAGDWQGAAEAWETLGCPYECARALAEGGCEAQIKALEIFDRLGAKPAARALRQNLKKRGICQMPREPRTSTRENPFGLTNRQLDVLSLLVNGLRNNEIASSLFISPKTVDHHVSAILASLDVNSRHEAAAHAIQHPYFQDRNRHIKAR
ncbi:MAG: AAA family ATPase [Myxococcota bacterium]|nr:AAA family ATPase [Myxococcota bacterium]